MYTVQALRSNTVYIVYIARPIVGSHPKCFTASDLFNKYQSYFFLSLACGIRDQQLLMFTQVFADPFVSNDGSPKTLSCSSILPYQTGAELLLMRQWNSRGLSLCQVSAVRVSPQ